MKTLIAILLFTGIAFSQTDELARDALADQAIEINELKKTNRNLSVMVDAFVKDLQAIENPSEELIAVMTKYGIYKEE